MCTINDNSHLGMCTINGNSHLGMCTINGNSHLGMCTINGNSHLGMCKGLFYDVMLRKDATEQNAAFCSHYHHM